MIKIRSIYGNVDETTCPFCGQTAWRGIDGRFTCFHCFSRGNEEDFRKTGGPENQIIEELKKVCRSANEYFVSHLKTDSRFLASRNLGPDECRRFSLGYDDGKLYSYLREDCGYRDEIITESGLCRLSSDSVTGCYDHFRYRVTFPVIDRNGDVLGFGARRINDGNTPKYINSPESGLFRKRNILYGIHEFAGDSDTIILVEGYMDVISLHRVGILNSAAVLGTAVSEGIVPLLNSLGIRRVFLCFDSDEAGINACLRAAPVLRKFFTTEVICIDGAKDPDEYLKNHSAEDFIRLKRVPAESLIAEKAGYDVETIVNMML